MQTIEITSALEARRCRYAQYRGEKATLVLNGLPVTGMVRAITEVKSSAPMRWTVTMVSKQGIAAYQFHTDDESAACVNLIWLPNRHHCGVRVSMTKPSRHHELVVLMQRYSQLGRLLPAEHDLDTGDLVAVAEAGLQCLRKKSVLRWRVGADAGDRGQIDANAAGGATLARLRIPTGLSFAPNSNMTMPRDTVSRMRAARGALGISI